MDESKEDFDLDENNQSLKEDLETCKSENKSLKTRISEVIRERDEALSRLRNSERLVYILSFIIIIIAVGFAVAISTRKAKCNDNLNNLISIKEEVKIVQKTTEQCLADLSNCNSILHNSKQVIKTNQGKIKQCNDKLTSSQTLLDKLTSTQTLLDQCKGKTCINEKEYDNINGKLEKCTLDLNNFSSKNTKSKNIDKQQNKNDRKQKKCQSCLQDVESFNKQGVHMVKNQVLHVIRVERPWRTARKDCWERGGDLAVPRNVDKLAEYLMEKEPDITNFWVGVSDLEKPEEFRGVNGGRVVGGWEPQNEIYRKGNPSEKSPGNDCARLTYTDPYSKGLVATNCEVMMHYICAMATNTQHDIFF